MLLQIQTYINKGHCNTPLIVVGSAGAGKSALMARSASLTLKNVTPDGIHGLERDILFLVMILILTAYEEVER